MRVALIAPPWLPVPPPAYGGTEVVLDTLARGLAAAGHDVVLATTGDSTCPVARTWVYGHARPDEMGSVVIELRHLIHAYAATRDVDIIHDHTVAGPFLAASAATGAVVTTNHGPFTDDVKALYRSTASHVPLVAISHHQASTAADVPIAAVIHHGLDTSRFPIGAGTGGYALFLGRMSPNKGVREAIRVARHAGVPLVIAAKQREQTERDYFNAEIRPLLGPDVHYAGEVGGPAKLELLGGAMALLNPICWDEPFGMCMIEALACGTPVVATPRGAVPEIIHDTVTGYLRRHTPELADALIAASNLDRAACRAAVEARFSMQRMAADHLAFYTHILTRTETPAPNHRCSSTRPTASPSPYPRS
jgi:glycosyltransferase involved in cell wall biosynthesis